MREGGGVKNSQNFVKIIIKRYQVKTQLCVLCTTLLLNEGIPRALKGKKLRLKNPKKLASESEGIFLQKVIPSNSECPHILIQVPAKSKCKMPSDSDGKHLQKMNAKCPQIPDEKKINFVEKKWKIYCKYSIQNNRLA